jgi:hypothetical protein
VLVFVTTRGHEFGVRPLVERSFDADLPQVAAWNYDQLLRADKVPQATFIFADIERLYPWEARLAAAAFRSLACAGLRCLNDPARVPARYELLRRLNRAGINPFDAYRAEDRPAPARFPVFVRAEQDHSTFLGGLLDSQAELDSHLDRLVAEGVPLRGLLVIEFCAEPVAPGIWRKFGSYRIGERLHVHSHVTQDSWMVKAGTPGLCPPWLYAVEHETVAARRCPEAVAEAFRLAGIEYGRADHASVGGRDVVYEINTNPTISPPEPQRSELRDRTLAQARAFMAEGLREIDAGDGTPVKIKADRLVQRFRRRAAEDLSPWRP